MALGSNNFQAGILAGVPRAARYLTLSVANPKNVRGALSARVRIPNIVAS